MSLRIDKQTSDDQRYATWVRVIKRIYDEHSNHAWSYYMFRLLRSVFNNNSELSQDGGFVMNWVAGTYVDSTLMLLRRELDQQAGTENLSNLLFDIAKYPTVLTRARHRANYSINSEHQRRNADWTFDSLLPSRVPGLTDEDHIDPVLVRRDLKTLTVDVAKCRVYAEQTRAHRAPEQSVDTSLLTFADLHAAITNVRATVRKYHLALTGVDIWRWEPVAQFSITKCFTKPWVRDERTVASGAREPESDGGDTTQDEPEA